MERQFQQDRRELSDADIVAAESRYHAVAQVLRGIERRYGRQQVGVVARSAFADSQISDEWCNGL